MLLMIMLCRSLFPFCHDASPPEFSTEMLNSSTSRLVTFIDFTKAQSSSTLTSLYWCCSLFNVVKMEQMIRTGDHLDAVGNTHILYEGYLYQLLLLWGKFSSLLYDILYMVINLIYLGNCFGRPVRVW